jgi:hypothetical protein
VTISPNGRSATFCGAYVSSMDVALCVVANWFQHVSKGLEERLDSHIMSSIGHLWVSLLGWLDDCFTLW